MVFETSSLELGTWSLELGTWNLELAAWNLELGTWSLELGLELGARNLDLAPLTWNLTLATWNLEHLGLLVLGPAAPTHRRGDGNGRSPHRAGGWERSGPAPRLKNSNRRRQGARQGKASDRKDSGAWDGRETRIRARGRKKAKDRCRINGLGGTKFRAAAEPPPGAQGKRKGSRAEKAKD